MLRRVEYDENCSYSDSVMIWLIQKLDKYYSNCSNGSSIQIDRLVDCVFAMEL